MSSSTTRRVESWPADIWATVFCFLNTKKAIVLSHLLSKRLAGEGVPGGVDVSETSDNSAAGVDGVLSSNELWESVFILRSATSSSSAVVRANIERIVNETKVIAETGGNDGSSLARTCWHRPHPAGARGSGSRVVLVEQGESGDFQRVKWRNVCACFLDRQGPALRLWGRIRPFNKREHGYGVDHVKDARGELVSNVRAVQEEAALHKQSGDSSTMEHRSTRSPLPFPRTLRLEVDTFPDRAEKGRTAEESSRHDNNEEARSHCVTQTFLPRVLEVRNKEKGVSTSPTSSSEVSDTNTPPRPSLPLEYCFEPKDVNKDVFSRLGETIIDDLATGADVSVVAYGQTGSGKTHTLQGYHDHEGLMPQILRNILPSSSSPSSSVELTAERRSSTTAGNTTLDKQSSARLFPYCTMEVFEIYNERVNDLLGGIKPEQGKEKLEFVRGTTDDDKGTGKERGFGLMIRSSPDVRQRFLVQGANKVRCLTFEKCFQVLEHAQHRRAVSQTMMSMVSSRSHLICQFHFPAESGNWRSNESTRTSSSTTTGAASEQNDDHPPSSTTLQFYDLAGSERIMKTGALGQQIREGVSIAKSLSAFGLCVDAMAQQILKEEEEEKLRAASGSSSLINPSPENPKVEAEEPRKRRMIHIPWRDSKLTMLLASAFEPILKARKRRVKHPTTSSDIPTSSTLHIIGTLSPSVSNQDETISTLRFLERLSKLS